MAGRVLATENSRVALTISSNTGQSKKCPQYLAAILGESNLISSKLTVKLRLTTKLHGTEPFLRSHQSLSYS
jgi:hypothetical protein